MSWIRSAISWKPRQALAHAQVLLLAVRDIADRPRRSGAQPPRAARPRSARRERRARRGDAPAPRASDPGCTPAPDPGSVASETGSAIDAAPASTARSGFPPAPASVKPNRRTAPSLTDSMMPWSSMVITRIDHGVQDRRQPGLPVARTSRSARRRSVTSIRAARHRRSPPSSWKQVASRITSRRLVIRALQPQIDPPFDARVLEGAAGGAGEIDRPRAGSMNAGNGCPSSRSRVHSQQLARGQVGADDLGARAQHQITDRRELEQIQVAVVRRLQLDLRAAQLIVLHLQLCLVNAKLGHELLAVRGPPREMAPLRARSSARRLRSSLVAHLISRSMLAR